MAGNAKVKKPSKSRTRLTLKPSRNGAKGASRAAPRAAARRPQRRSAPAAPQVQAGARRPVAVRTSTRPPARPIGKRDFREFRRLLDAERQRLTEELEALEEHIIPEPEGQVGMDVAGSSDEDFADVAGEAFEREKGFAIESTVQALLKQVEEALTRLDAGTYGVCSNCGQPIHPERLKAIPYATLCINCKANEERANGFGR